MLPCNKKVYSLEESGTEVIVKTEFSEESLPHMSVMVVDKLLSRVHGIDMVRGLSRTGPAVAALA